MTVGWKTPVACEAGERRKDHETGLADNQIKIERMANGEPFDMNKTYQVAVNSYRGNGGGDLLTKGAGIPKTELAKRIVYSTDKDLRFYLMKRIEEVKVLDPKPLNQWKFIPEDWTVPASKRDYDILFGEKKAVE